MVRLLVGLAITATAGFGQTGEVICGRTAEAPVVDGELGEACWAEAATIEGFTRPLTEEVTAKAVRVRVCFDEEALYLGIECEEHEPERLTTRQQPGSEDVWQDDCIEIWLRTSTSQLAFDQLIVNAAGVTQTLRRRPGGGDAAELLWEAAAKVGADTWTAEVAVPFSSLGIEAPKAGEMIQLKLGREDHTGPEAVLSTWPPKSPYAGAEGYGRLYFKTANLLPDPDMSEGDKWGFGEGDEGRFSSVDDEGRQVIRFETPGVYSVAQQGLRLKPNSAYRLDARVRGTAGCYLRARTSKLRGEASTAYTVDTKASEEYVPVEVSFPTGEDGSALIIIGNTESHGPGEVYIADLRISQAIAFEADGPAIPLPVGEPLVVTKVLPTDCRALRGFITNPVDGRLDSYQWDANVWEYGQGNAGAGVGYRYKDNDGLHITLADAEGIDAVIIRKGARVKLYQGSDRYDDPGNAPLVWEFKGRAQTSRALLGERVTGDRFSFFELEDGLIADCQFLRIGGERPEGEVLELGVRGTVEAGDPREVMARRFGEEERVTYGLAEGGSQPFAAEAKRAVQLVSGPLGEVGIEAVSVRLTVPEAPTGCPLRVSVQDPLNPRGELMSADFALEGGGVVEPVLDIPDQVLLDGARLWVTLTFGAPVRVEQATARLHLVSGEAATPEALAWRKLMMKGMHAQLSEARQWNTYRGEQTLEEWAETNQWGAGVVDLAETIAQCKALGPDDDMVRCYDEWVWRNSRELPPFEPTIDEVPGAPEWAVVARQAWLTARAVPEWWLDERLVPTGEFGGLVGDDSDMYQNWVDYPFFETEGVAARMREAAAALAELAEEENLENGLNLHTTDPLHAYEEGVNQEALMVTWFYGDPVYLERCMAAAKSMPALTVVTEKGHRHFKNQSCGAEDLRIDRELGVDGHAHPLMLHPCFEVAWYNRNPQVIQFLREWADGWLEHQAPGEYATSVDVATEEVTEKNARPLYGGYGGQASAHNFLYWVTDDLSYLGPFFDFWNRDEDMHPARRFVPELWQRGALDGLEEKDGVLAGHPVTKAIALGEKQALVDALKADIAELQRFGMMYKEAEVFTDRVFLDEVLTNVALCYTGGFATRNKYNHTHAVSWEGFSTNYAALVLEAKRDRFKALAYNFAEEDVEGAMRLWTLDPGTYRLEYGPDADGDDDMDRAAETGEHSISRATRIPVTLKAKQVTIIELEQLAAREAEFGLPDLAVSPLDTKVEGKSVTVRVHNIGGGDAPATMVALLDSEGEEVERKAVGALAAPVDLEPKVAEVRFEDVEEGWRVVVDPDGEIEELYEGNNGVG